MTTDLWGLLQDVATVCDDLVDSSLSKRFDALFSDDVVIARQDLATAAIMLLKAASEFNAAVKAEENWPIGDANDEHRLSMQQLGVTPGRTS